MFTFLEESNLKLLVLCVDGLLEPGHPNRPTIPPMKYEKSLEIPSELRWSEDNHPWTMHIWPSMFTGKINRYPEEAVKVRRPGSLRLNVRKFLHTQGLKWYRKGLKSSIEKKDWGFRNIVLDPVIDRSLFDDYNSFTYSIPGVNYGYVFGSNIRTLKDRYEHFKVLARMLPYTSYDLAGIYHSLVDRYAHLGINSEFIYNELNLILNSLDCDVIVLSDHGSDPETHAHTEHAYIGTTFPFNADTVLDVYNVIKNFMLMRSNFHSRD